MIGKIFKSNSGEDFEVVEVMYKDNKNQYYKIKFNKTGYETVVNKSNIVKGKIKDRLSKSIYGVGYLGKKVKHDNPKLHEKLYGIWRHMLGRCYNDKDLQYEFYGLKGVRVEENWHCFYNFFNDVLLLNGFNERQLLNNKIQLDKDILQPNIIEKIYSKNTCIWLDVYENISLSGNRNFLAISPDGKEYICNNAKIFAEEHNLNQKCISRCVRGERPHHRGWIFKSLVGDVI
ncbi:TPA: hypothetical protein PTV31_003140 [Clostridium botulinum]|nr:hypothetical protein [Clostridium botulinum]